MYFSIVGPDGQTYIVMAADAGKALAQARAYFTGKFGATDMNQWQGAPNPIDPAEAQNYIRSYPEKNLSGTGSTSGNNVKPSMPAKDGFEWTQGSDGTWTETPIKKGTATIGGIVGYNPEDPYSSLADQYRAAQGAALGRPLDQSMFRSQIGQQAAPYASSFHARGALGMNSGQDDPLQYQKYVLQNNPNDAYSNSADAFQKLLALASGGGEQNQLDMANEYLNPDVQSDGQLNNATQLGLGAARNKYGAWSSAFLPGVETYVNRFRSSMPTAGMDTAGRYLQFLKSQLGI